MEIVSVPITSLSPHSRNYRSHPEAQLAHLQASLQEFGWARNVVISSDNVILAGHGIVEAARRRGETEVPVHRLNLPSTDPKAEKFMVLENEVSRLAEDDETQLAALLADVQSTEGLDGTGWDDRALDALIGELAKQDRENAPLEDPGPEEPPVDPVTKLGDVWCMGEHRLVCGDAISEAAWEAIGGEAAGRVAFWSPPYALGKSIKLSGNKARSQAGDAYVSGQDSADGWRELIDGMVAHAARFCEVSVVNVQPLAGNKRDLLRWMADNSGRLCDIVTWDKQAAQPPAAQGVMASRYEWLVVLGAEQATRSIPLSSWRGTLQSVYVGPPQRNNEYADIHGATFPTHLPAFVLGELCDLSASVVDCCMGTGTTLIAAEQLGRVCYGIEIEPRYVDVSVRRWCKATGRTATLESTGEPFPMPAPEGA